jgi:SAM-dependent methyltransferase
MKSMTEELERDLIRRNVRETYSQIVERDGNGCGCSPTCCAPAAAEDATQVTRGGDATANRLGYSPQDLTAVPDGANLGLGCGNPLAIASLRPGLTVLDLGSGAGFDAFLAARAVGPSGRVIGVDMTPAMVSRARGNAAKGDYSNVEFRLGEIESLPVADGSVEVILSNCVINLSPDKPRVFREVFRVLRPGGRLAIADIVAFQPLPDALRRDAALYASCAAGAAEVRELERALREAGFVDIKVTFKPGNRAIIAGCFPDRGLEEFLDSATIEAVKPHIQ